MARILEFPRKESGDEARIREVATRVSGLIMQGVNLRRFIDLKKTLADLHGSRPHNDTLATYERMVRGYNDEHLAAKINNFDAKKVKSRRWFYLAVISEAQHRMG